MIHAISGCMLLASNGGVQSILNSKGIGAQRIETLWWWMAVVATVVTIATVTLAWLPMLRRGERDLSDRGAWKLIIAGGVAIPVLAIFGLLIYSVYLQRVMAAPADRANAIEVEVIAQRWWWDFFYKADSASERVRSSNELHIPVGVPVHLFLESRDVIHTFWAPTLGPKVDMIPGRKNQMWLQASEPGRYRGQCAEFCGLQHAHMAFDVVAEEPAAYAAWLDHQRQEARQPADPYLKYGQQVFLSSPCVMCHRIRGTEAQGGLVAPDLTHVASRISLGAGTIPNTPGHMAGWVVDPQLIQPGAHMPPNTLAPDDLNALLAYLQTLK